MASINNLILNKDLVFMYISVPSGQGVSTSSLTGLFSSQILSMFNYETTIDSMFVPLLITPEQIKYSDNVNLVVRDDVLKGSTVFRKNMAPTTITLESYFPSKFVGAELNFLGKIPSFLSGFLPTSSTVSDAVSSTVRAVGIPPVVWTNMMDVLVRIDADITIVMAGTVNKYYQCKLQTADYNTSTEGEVYYKIKLITKEALDSSSISEQTSKLTTTFF